MKNKKLLIVLAAVLVVCVAAFAIIAVVTRQNASDGVKNITVTVVHSDGTRKPFEIKTEAQYLREVLEAKRLVAGTESEYGLFITVVDGEEANWEKDKAYWSLMINGEYAQTGVDSTPVVDGSKYELVYTK